MNTIFSKCYVPSAVDRYFLKSFKFSLKIRIKCQSSPFYRSTWMYLPQFCWNKVNFYFVLRKRQYVDKFGDKTWQVGNNKPYNLHLSDYSLTNIYSWGVIKVDNQVWGSVLEIACGYILKLKSCYWRKCKGIQQSVKYKIFCRIDSIFFKPQICQQSNPTQIETSTWYGDKYTQEHGWRSI